MRIFWFLCGVISVALGAIGIVLPLLPTVPFFLLAAFCFARSSDSAHMWLLNHKTFGPPISDWNETGVIRLPIKVMATVFMMGGLSLSTYLDVKLWVLALQFAILSCVTIFIWTRPSE